MIELYRVIRVAKILDVTRKQVYHLINEGKLECVKLGPRQLRVSRSSIEAYLKERKQAFRLERGLDLLERVKKLKKPHSNCV